MAAFNIFSRRQKPAPDVLTYDDIPHTLRIQLLNAMDDARWRIREQTVPPYEIMGTEGKDCFAFGCTVLRRELGLGQLVSQQARNRRESANVVLADEFTTFFENCATEHVLDAIEVVMDLIEQGSRYLDHECNATTVADEINARFKQHGVGYQYESGQIIVESNRVLHAEATVPALLLLAGPTYENANEEFRKAHEHYRHRRNAECLVDCLKAFESTMKIICENKGWPYNQNDTASKLIKVCLENELIPTFSDQQLTSLRTLLESGVPTVRNKQGGHGQGAQRIQVSDSLARFALHLTAAAILLLVESADW